MFSSTNKPLHSLRSKIRLNPNIYQIGGHNGGFIFLRQMRNKKYAISGYKKYRALKIISFYFLLFGWKKKVVTVC